MNTIEKHHSSGVNGSITTNTFEEAEASISILDGRILVITLINKAVYLTNLGTFL